MPYFQKKSVIVEAVEITEPLEIPTLEGTMRGEVKEA